MSPLLERLAQPDAEKIGVYVLINPEQARGLASPPVAELTDAFESALTLGLRSKGFDPVYLGSATYEGSHLALSNRKLKDAVTRAGVPERLSSQDAGALLVVYVMVLHKLPLEHRAGITYEGTHPMLMGASWLQFSRGANVEAFSIFQLPQGWEKTPGGGYRSFTPREWASAATNKILETIPQR